MYKQCTLQKNKIKQHAWIPAEFAKVGKLIFFEDKQTADNVWTVISAGNMAVSPEYVRELERDHLHQRKASDI